MTASASDDSTMKPEILNAEALRFHEVMEELYRKPGAWRGSIDTETGRFLYSLARMVRPELVVEVGTQHGISTLWLARAVKDNGTGQLLSLDLFEDTQVAVVQQSLERAGLSKQAELIAGPSTTIGAEACRRSARPIDLLFIDGDHRVEAATVDFEVLSAMVRAGGFVVLHDIYPESCGWDGPRYILDFVAGKRSEAAKWQILEFPTPPSSFGLAVMQKKAADAQTRILPRPAYWLYQWRTRFRFWLRGGGRM
jgi:predicted O-methyltransferase YrrM